MRMIKPAAVLALVLGSTGWTFGAVYGPVDEVDQERLMATLRELPPNRSAWGPDANREALLKTEEWVLSSLKAIGYEVTEHPFEAPIPQKRWKVGAAEVPAGEAPVQPETLKTRNFSIDIRGTSQPREVLLVGAHFDSVDGTPGADDNGTGTAALMELARVLKDEKPERTIRLVFFTMEEQGLIGAKHYVTDWKATNKGEGAERIVGMMSLEMLGFFRDEADSQKTPPGLDKLAAGLALPTVGNFIAITGLAKHQHFSGPLADAMTAGAPGLVVFRADFFPFAIPDLYRSDHAPFMMADIPAVMITDTSNYRNPNYHKETDTPETVDAPRFTLTVKGVAAAILELSKAGTAEPKAIVEPAKTETPATP